MNVSMIGIIASFRGIQITPSELNAFSRNVVFNRPGVKNYNFSRNVVFKTPGSKIYSMSRIVIFNGV